MSIAPIPRIYLAPYKPGLPHTIPEVQRSGEAHRYSSTLHRRRLHRTVKLQVGDQPDFSELAILQVTN